MSSSSKLAESRFGKVPIEKFLDSVVQLEQLDTDLFRSHTLITPKHARGTFGGQLIAHALQAAQATVSDEEKVPHSLRSNFLLAGDSEAHMYYSVRRVRDGKSFAVRNVTAFQRSEVVYVATVSFHRREKPGITHAPESVHAMEPNQAVSQVDMLARLIDGAPTTQLKENLRRKVAPTVEIRYTNRMSIAKPLVTTQPLVSWMRATGIPKDAKTHRAVAGFISDFTLALSTIAPHGMPNPDLRMLVSLDHTIYFHDDFDVTEWVLYEVKSTWAGANRALCNGRVFTMDGRMVMTVIQETLVRMSKDFRSHAKL